MKWPFVDPRARITDSYRTQRKRGLHRAWDVAAKAESGIRAPEGGRLQFLYMVRAGRPRPEASDALGILTGNLAAYSWYFADRYGGCSILYGQQYWWVFAHTPVEHVFWHALDKGAPMQLTKWRDADDASRFVELYASEPVEISGAGEIIGTIGDSGYSTGPHTHLEVAPIGYAGGAPSRIDPAGLFPKKAAELLAA